MSPKNRSDFRFTYLTSARSPSANKTVHPTCCGPVGRRSPQRSRRRTNLRPCTPPPEGVAQQASNQRCSPTMATIRNTPRNQGRLDGCSRQQRALQRHCLELPSLCHRCRFLPSQQYGGPLRASSRASCRSSKQTSKDAARPTSHQHTDPHARAYDHRMRTGRKKVAARSL